MFPKMTDIQERINLVRCTSGTVDLSLPAMCWSKSNLAMKATERRFVSGNTAFNRIDDVPMLPLKDQAKVSDAVYQDVFRGVSASDCFGKGAESDEEDEDVEVGDPQDDKKGPAKKVLFFLFI